MRPDRGFDDAAQIFEASGFWKKSGDPQFNRFVHFFFFGETGDHDDRDGLVEASDLL